LIDFWEISRNWTSDRFPAPGISRSMTNFGMGVPLMRGYASKDMERFQDRFAEAAPVTENGREGKNEVAMDLRSLQKPLKEQYRKDPNASHITLRAKGAQTDVPITCSVDIGRAIYHAEAHHGVGGG